MLLVERTAVLEESLLAREAQLQPALIAQCSEEFPRVARVGEELGGLGELGEHGRQIGLAVRETTQRHFVPVGDACLRVGEKVVEEGGHALDDRRVQRALM